MKVVAVSQRIEYLPERSERRDMLDQRLVAFLASCDVLAVPVPNILVQIGELNSWLKSVQPHGIVLSGGNDIGQYPERDQTEKTLLVCAEELEMPVLGICRGMQMLGIFAGTELEVVADHAGTRHLVSGEIEGEVNSFHNYALKNVPEHYSALANSNDGVIEAVRHAHLPWEGWMWHPEREAEFVARDIDRAEALLT
jgi:gamma-glutamyl-gamma-aminobutyrate hydrolase PuuD